MPSATPSRKPLRLSLQATSPATSTPWRLSSAASWAARARSCPTSPRKCPMGPKPESRVKLFARWFDNAHILEEVYFLPYADVLLHHLALQTLVLVMDGSGVGRGCTALMIHVVYKGRALPLAWRGRQSPKGPLPADR